MKIGVAIYVVVAFASTTVLTITFENREDHRLPKFSNVVCPSEHNAYAVCIKVNYEDGGDDDLLLLNEKSPFTHIVLHGHLKDEPDVTVVVILPDEDNPTFTTIALSSQRVAWCSKFSVDFETGETQCIKDPHPTGNDEIVMVPDSPRENERSLLEQTLNPRAVDANGYRLNVVVYYDEAFHKKFSSRARTRIAAIMALVDEQYSESSFKTKLEVNTKAIRYAQGYDWGNLVWQDANYPNSQTFNELASLARNSDVEANLYVFLTDSPSQSYYGLVPKIGSLCDSSKDRRVSMTRYLNGDADTAMTVAHEVAHNLGIKHDCMHQICGGNNYVGPRDHDGKDCYGYMDYRDDTPGWSECSVSDFADYVNSKTRYCLERIDSSSTEFTNQVCQNTLPSDYKPNNCNWNCDQWAGVGGNGNNYCNSDWSNFRQCVPTTSGKIKDYCQMSCNSDTCGCRDTLPSGYGNCNWSCAQWAGINGNGRNFCNNDWSTQRNCVPYSTGTIKNYCKLSCNNCERAGCKKFELTSSGGIRSSQSNRLGYYVREDKLTNGRVAYYNRGKGQYLYWMIGYWLAGPTKGGDNGGIRNRECIDVKHPADGNCNSGWEYWAGNGWQLDNTVRLICKD